MHARDGGQVRAVLRVEVFLIGRMGEEVGEGVAGIHDGVRRHIIVHNCVLQGDALLRQDLLGNLQHVAVGIQGADHLDGLAVQGGVIHVGIIAVGGIVDGGNGSVGVGREEVHHLLAQHSRRQGLGFGGIHVLRLHGNHVHIGRFAVFEEQGLVQDLRRQGVVAVDDAKVNVRQHVGHHGRFHFFKLDPQGIFRDIRLGGRDARVFLQLDHALGLEQQQRAALVGGIVGHGNRHGTRGRGAQHQRQSTNQSNQFFHIHILLL